MRGDRTSLLALLKQGCSDLMLHDTTADSGHISRLMDRGGVQLAHIDLDAFVYFLQSVGPAMGTSDGQERKSQQVRDLDLTITSHVSTAR